MTVLKLKKTVRVPFSRRIPKWNKNGETVCVSCGKKPAIVKKTGECRLCYQKEYAKINGERVFKRTFDTKTDPRTDSKIQNRAEIQFALNNNGLLHHPVCFHLGEGKYLPDFYDPERNVFYEVIGSRQRFHQITPKLEMFRKIFPWINLIVCCADGSPYPPKEEGYSFPLTPEQIEEMNAKEEIPK